MKLWLILILLESLQCIFNVKSTFFSLFFAFSSFFKYFDYFQTFLSMNRSLAILSSIEYGDNAYYSRIHYQFLIIFHHFSVELKFNPFSIYVYRIRVNFLKINIILKKLFLIFKYHLRFFIRHIS